MQQKQEDCSHIISINRNTVNPPSAKGNLFLGSIYSLKPKNLYSKQINCIFTIIDKYMYNSIKINKKLESINIQHHKWIQLDDDEQQDIYRYLLQSHSYIKEKLQNCNVLVHCQMGKSRSSAIVIGYLIKEYGMGYYQAKNLVKNKRPIVNPNYGFEKALKDFEQYVRKQNPQQFIQQKL